MKNLGPFAQQYSVFQLDDILWLCNLYSYEGNSMECVYNTVRPR